MSGKAIGWIFFIFCGLVLVNYGAAAAQNFFAGRGLAAAGFFPFPTVGAQSGQGLASIDFSVFAKNGPGISYITQGYGRTAFSYMYPNGWHDGIDIAAVYGAPIYAPVTGTVLAVGNQDNYCPGRGFGKYVAIKDDADGLVLWFAHLGTFGVSADATIKKGDLLGTVGATGLETGTHLHFSVFDANGFVMTPRDGCGPEPTGKDLNPMNYLGNF